MGMELRLDEIPTKLEKSSKLGSFDLWGHIMTHYWEWSQDLTNSPREYENNPNLDLLRSGE